MEIADKKKNAKNLKLKYIFNTNLIGVYLISIYFYNFYIIVIINTYIYILHYYIEI